MHGALLGVLILDQADTGRRRLHCDTSACYSLRDGIDIYMLDFDCEETTSLCKFYDFSFVSERTDNVFVGNCMKLSSSSAKNVKTTTILLTRRCRTARRRVQHDSFDIDIVSCNHK